MDLALVDADRDAVTSFYESHPLLFDSTRRSVSVAAWLYDMELIFHICHIEAHLHVSLASRCLISDARLWWMTQGERQMPSRTWAHFRAAVLAQYGPIPAEGVGEPYRDLEIYRDMQHTRYQSFVADWHAYPQESMGHYCRRFQEAMLPHIPQDLPSPELQALVILRNGVPPQIRQFVPTPMLERSVGSMIDDILEAEIIAHMMQPDGFVNDYQEVPAHEAEDQMDAQDAADDLVTPEDQPEDPPVIDISSDDEDDGEEHEPGYGGWLDEGDEFDVDPEEILFDDVTRTTARNESTSRTDSSNEPRPQVNEVPPRAHQVPPVVPQAPDEHPNAQPEVQTEIPRNAEIPMAPVGRQVNLQPVREDLLYERFRSMKAPKFEGPTDPIAADNWLIDIQVILDFMQLTEQEKVLCASFALKKDARHWWMTVQMRRDVTA
ncbi:hypothetical protein TIFTF001_031363 [Ficus carica]|uniref:Retrotransposon gag domain-containing protein n=1 Tax=Ficus carica TaxID=3494 RepID=A0AA88DV72_FICCA|nr:hypothetical protein TIFTF001_031363 [Ficus carica]